MQTLSTPVLEGRLDIARLVDLVARREVPAEIPRLPSPTMRHGVQVLVDYGDAMMPFRDDQRRLLREVQDLAGSAFFEVFLFRGTPTRWSRPLMTPRNASIYELPPSGTPILALTDLGIGALAAGQPYMPPEEWFAFARSAISAECQLTAFVPYHPDRCPPVLRGELAIVHWHHARGTLGVRATTIADGSAEVQHTLEDLWRRNPHAVALAQVASLASRVELSLLRELRYNLLPAVDGGAEADLWFSPLASVRGERSLLLRPEVTEVLRRSLFHNYPRLFEDAWRIVKAYRSRTGAFEGTQLEEEINYWLAQGGNQTAAKVEELLRRVVKTVLERGTQNDKEGLALWSVELLDNLPKAARDSEAGQDLAVAAGLRLDPHYIPQGILPNDLSSRQWLLPQDADSLRTTSLWVGREPEGLVFSSREDLISNGKRLDEVPATTPLVLWLSWDSGTRREKVSIVPGQKAGPIDTSDHLVTIETFTGNTWTLSPLVVTNDLLERKRTHFSLWRPYHTAPPPRLIIGIFQGGDSSTLTSQRAFDLQPSMGASDLWELPVSACNLVDGQVYHYWFEVADSNPYKSTPTRIWCTDPTAWTVDWRLRAPPLPAPYSEDNRAPAAVVRYQDGRLVPCDPGGELPDWSGDSRLEALPSNQRLVIYELPTSWARSETVNGREVAAGTFRDVIALIAPDDTPTDFAGTPARAQAQAHLLTLGVNAIQLLPVTDSFLQQGWGDAPSNFFAPSQNLSFPHGNESPTATRDLTALVKCCHTHGMRFFVDMVLSAAWRSAYESVNFPDFHVQGGSGDPNEHIDDGRVRQDFGGALFNYNLRVEGYDPVSGQTRQLVPARQLMLTYLARWMLDFRIDGIWMDSVGDIGNWDLVQEFKNYARTLWRGRWERQGLGAGADERFLVVGEELAMPLDLLTQNRLDGLWNELFKRMVRHVILGEKDVDDPGFEATVRKLIDCRLAGFRDGTQAINYVTSHNMEGFRNERLFNFLVRHGLNIEQIEPRIKLAFVCLLTAVGIPMILAGEEFADEHELPIVRSQKQLDAVNYDRVQEPWRQRIFEHVARLVKFRTSYDALTVNDTKFIHIDLNDGKKVVVWHRGREDSDRQVVVVANFSDYGTPDPSNPRAEYVVPAWPAPQPGHHWREITEDRDVAEAWVGREPIFPWQAKVYALQPATARPNNWVLVAGLGTYDLPTKVLETSERLGEMLAKEGYGLIVGGWPGVDHVVARKFVEVLTQFEKSDQEFLVQVVGPHGPDYRKGQVIRTPTDEEEFTEGITRANVVVLISGKGGTLHVGELARQQDKPVLPLADTDDDAREAYRSILDTWDRKPIRGISKEEFTTLNTPAPQVIDHLMTLIRKSIGARQMVQIGEVRFPTEDPKAHEFYDGDHKGLRKLYVSVTFDHPFTRPPKVVVSLQKIDLQDVVANIHRIAVRAENIRLEGFDLYFETWDDSRIYSAGASWIAVGE
jgi:1,4-alpha-glucan branching enzyme